ncbi:MAG: hypothetical protein IJM32_04720 [Ruminococcus sp.]|nr:hypothetical protein [Ruminococcus sp.]
MKTKKMKILIIILIVVLVLAVGGYIFYSNFYRFPEKFRDLKNNSLSADEVEKLKEDILKKDNVKILVTYYSYSGTTKGVAKELSDHIGADQFEIKTEEEYSNVYIQANRQIRKKTLPKLVGSPEKLDEYDIVFVGYPVWWHATPTAINAFLESNDLKGKLVIPFCTSGGSDIDETMPTFLDSCDGLAVDKGKTLSGMNDIKSWIKDLGLESIIKK